MNRKINHSSMLLDKLPPQAKDLEEVVIAALLIDKKAILAVYDFLKPEMFYVEDYATIYATIRNLELKKTSIDLLTVAEALKSNGELEVIGGRIRLMQIADRVGSSAHILDHAKIIYEKYLKREIIRIGTEYQQYGHDDSYDIFDLINKLDSNWTQLTSNLSAGDNAPSFGETLNEVILETELLRQQETELVGLPSGFRDVDKMLGGLKGGELIVIAGRPAMGKTALVLAILKYLASIGVPVGILSLEMSRKALIKRIISMETRIPLHNYVKAKYSNADFDRIQLASVEMEDYGIHIMDTTSISIDTFRLKAREYIREKNVKIFVIDYLQLMSGSVSGKGFNREQEISGICRALKIFAMENNIPIIALSQLSRAVETRGGDKRPILADLRESGAIEQDADVVGFMYRPEYYGFDNDEQGNSLKGIAELNIAKQRNGPTGAVPLRFISAFAEFRDYNQDD